MRKLKNLGLTSKLIGSISLVVIISFVATIGMISFKSKNLIYDRAVSQMDTITEEYSNMIGAEFGQVISVLSTVANIVASSKEDDFLISRHELSKMLEANIKNLPYLGMWMVFEPNAYDGADSAHIGHDGHSKTGQFVPYWNKVGGLHIESCTTLDLEWYTKPRDTKKTNITQPFEYDVGGKKVQMVSAGVPIIVNGKSIGVVGIDFSMEQIGSIIDKVKPFGTGNGALMTDDLIIVGHANKEHIGKHLDDVYSNALRSLVTDPSIHHVKETSAVSGKDVLAASDEIPIPGNEGAYWHILAGVPLDTINVEVNEIRNLSIIVAASSLSILILILYFVGKGIILKPINSLVTNLEDIADGEGDLTKELEIKSNDELGKLSETFNRFVGKLRDMIKEISHNVDELKASSNVLAELSEESKTSTIKTSEVVTSVAASSEEMSTNFTSIAASMEQSSTNLNTVATATEEMSSTINEIARNSETARGIAENAVSVVKESADRVDSLSQSANEINSVVDTINDISEQVNLLSLNATIEAARAGDAGKGFAVVANEIKALANQVSEASQNIKEKIIQIQTESKTTMGGMTNIEQVIGEVNDIVNTIATAVEEQSSATQEIAENINQASTGVEEVNVNVNTGIDVIKSVSEDMSGVQQSTNSIAENNTQIDTKADELDTISDRLSNLVNKFKV